MNGNHENIYERDRSKNVLHVSANTYKTQQDNFDDFSRNDHEDMEVLGNYANQKQNDQVEEKAFKIPFFAHDSTSSFSKQQFGNEFPWETETFSDSITTQDLQNIKKDQDSEEYTGYEVERETDSILKELHLIESENNFHTHLDALHRLYKVKGPELNRAYLNSVRCLTESDECPEKTRFMLEERIMMYPHDQKMDQVKKAVILYSLCIIPEMKEMFSQGYNGGQVNTHKYIRREHLDVFIDRVINTNKQSFMRCTDTPHTFVQNVFTVLKNNNGVEGYFRNIKNLSRDSKLIFS